MPELIVVAAAILLVAAFWQARSAGIRRQTRGRFTDEMAEQAPPAEHEERRRHVRPALRRRPWLPVVVAAVVGAALLFLVGLPLSISVALSFVVGVLAWMAEEFPSPFLQPVGMNIIAARRKQRDRLRFLGEVFIFVLLAIVCVSAMFA